MAVRLVVRHPQSAEGEAGEASFEFQQTRIVIGRSPGADVRLPSQSVSESHATIEQRGDHYTLRDERSLNGTELNGAALVPNRARILGDGDQIAIAEFTLLFRERGLVQPTTPERTASLARRMLRELLGQESNAAEPAYLDVVDGPDRGTRVNLLEPPARMIIGRGRDAHLALSDVDVSRAHVQLDRDSDCTIVRDIESKNGLEINGRLYRERRLRHGDVLRIGSTSLLYQDPAEHALRALEKEPVVTITRTRPAAAKQIEPEPERESEPEPEPALELEPPRTWTSSLLDSLVYLLAAVILATSIAGLVWLLR